MSAPDYTWLQQPVTTIAWCWLIKRADGVTMGFTSHDQNLVINGVIYEASTGFSPSAVSTTNGMAVDNVDVDGFLDSESLTLIDINSGRYDGAIITVFLADWMNLNHDMLTVRKGTIGQVTGGRTSFKAEIRGLMQPYQQQSMEVYSNWCRADLGDTKCQVNLTSYTFTGAITAVNSDGSININVVQAADYFDYGLITFTSGQSNNCQYDIKLYTVTNGVANLLTFLPFDYPVAVGDTFTIQAGCDGNLLTCQTKFNNVINFRGEPYTPGTDYMMTYPCQS
jgi:uncharacterized phage protein (TIGR02218 family)